MQYPVIQGTVWLNQYDNQAKKIGMLQLQQAIKLMLNNKLWHDIIISHRLKGPLIYYVCDVLYRRFLKISKVQMKPLNSEKYVLHHPCYLLISGPKNLKSFVPRQKFNQWFWIPSYKLTVYIYQDWGQKIIDSHMYQYIPSCYSYFCSMSNNNVIPSIA